LVNCLVSWLFVRIIVWLAGRFVLASVWLVFFSVVFLFLPLVFLYSFTWCVACSFAPSFVCLCVCSYCWLLICVCWFDYVVSYRIQLSSNFSAISLKDFRNFVQFLYRNVGLLPKNSLRFSTSKRLRNTHLQPQRRGHI